MSNIFSFLIASEKVSPYVIFLILLLPVIATLVALVRQVVGIKMINAYAPILTVYAFLGTGFLPGLIIAFIIFLVNILLRMLTKKLRIHYLPRISILMTLSSIIVLVLLPLASSLPFLEIQNISAISIVLFIALSDIYVTSESQSGYKKATNMFLETIFISAIIFVFVSWGAFQRFLISYPEIILLFLALDFIIGRWTFLRLTEIYRFRSVIKEKAKDYA